MTPAPANWIGGDRLKHRLRGILLPCLLFLAAGVGTASACSVPVFRYALERWPADDYLAVVFHEGALTPEQSACVGDLDRGGLAGKIFANLSVRTVDLASVSDPQLLRLWRDREAGATLPAIVLLSPPGLRASTPVWSGPLNGDSVRLVLDSPVRREIARRLLNSDSAVWALIESGDSAFDATAAQVLETRLKHLEATLELQELNPDDISGVVAASQEVLKIAFSSIRLSRKDPAEAVLVGMLLNIEEDLESSGEPVVIPIFGQGRALYALLGRGINPKMIDEAGRFLTGACSCIVKEENPGSDLLMAFDWAGLVEPFINNDRELPPLSGIAEFASGKATGAGSGRALPSAPAIAMATIAEVAAPDAGEANGEGDMLLRGLILMGGLGGGILIGATWWLLRRQG